MPEITISLVVVAALCMYVVLLVPCFVGELLGFWLVPGRRRFDWRSVLFVPAIVLLALAATFTVGGGLILLVAFLIGSVS